MKIAHFDCFSGISGDMVMGALVDRARTCVLIEEWLRRLNFGMENLRGKGDARALARPR